MLRNKPKLKYCGITVVLGNPSRFDKASLLTATGGCLFNDLYLRPEFNQMQCDIRLADEIAPLLPDTHCILLLGESACHKMIPQSRGNSIGEIRGNIYYYNKIPCIPTFFPQDACDFKNLEVKLNPLNPEYSPDAADEVEDTDDYESIKRHGKTSRRNFAFWIKQDCAKAKTIINNGGKVPAPEFLPIYHIYPTSQVVINLLSSTKNQTLFFDIETDYEEQNLQCFAFSFDGVNIYSVPILDYLYRPAYSSYHLILRALAVAFRDNLVIAHNGACFDFFVLAYKYHLPVNRVYDTMIAQHRIYPDIEKSLGHCTSLWTWENFHKDEDSKGYMSREQLDARLKYCGKDVFTLALVYKAQQAYAKKVVGLSDSISTAMAAIRPYLITSLQGIQVDKEKVIEAARENDRLMMQYDRIIRLLIGEKSMAAIKSSIKGKAGMFAGSNSQCITYFHEMLGYPVVARSMKTEKPSLGKKAMYKLALKFPENPVIQFVLAYRTIAKEFGTYKFIPWKNDDGTFGTHSLLEAPPEQQEFSV